MAGGEAREPQWCHSTCHHDARAALEREGAARQAVNAVSAGVVGVVGQDRRGGRRGGEGSVCDEMGVCRNVYSGRGISCTLEHAFVSLATMEMEVLGQCASEAHTS